MFIQFGAFIRRIGLFYVASLLAIGAIGGCASHPAQKPAAPHQHQCHVPRQAHRSTGTSSRNTHRRKTRPGTTSHAKPKLQLAANAPHRYTVKKGDTLWDLAATFLKDPWHWPQLWAQNPDIQNPNRIYPGETLVLTRSINGRLKLRPAGKHKLKPKVRAKPLADAVPAIPETAIQVFLHGDRIVAQRKLNNAPHIVAFGNSVPAATTGRRTYIKGLQRGGPDRYQIVATAGPLKNPHTGRVYGTKVRNVGELKVTQRGPVSTATITHSERVAVPGDRLLPLPTRPLDRGYHPHAPRAPVHAKVIDLSGDQPVASQYQVVTISAGALDCLSRGATLNVYAPGRSVTDPDSGRNVQLPGHQVGTVMIFQTGPHYAFGLVMRSEQTIRRGYVLRSPGE